MRSTHWFFAVSCLFLGFFNLAINNKYVGVFAIFAGVVNLYLALT